MISLGDSYGLSNYERRSGCFSEDARGVWDVNIKVEKKVGEEVLDSGWGWGILKTQVKYKSHEAAGVFKKVSESFSTQECSACASRSGPKGLAGLGVSRWICSFCGAGHDRNKNAAQNILVNGLLEISQEALRAKGKSMSVEPSADEKGCE
jgi:transposase